MSIIFKHSANEKLTILWASVLVLALMLNGCFKPRLNPEYELQEELLNPGNGEECWTLAALEDEEDIFYYRKEQITPIDNIHFYNIHYGLSYEPNKNYLNFSVTLTAFLFVMKTITTWMTV